MSEHAFFSQAWADAARAAIGRGPAPEYRATRLDTYWDWIQRAGAGFNGSLALGARRLPGGGEAYLCLSFSEGKCTAAQVVSPAEAAQADFVLAGDYAAWQSIMAGYDMGKAVMYRKLRLESGEVLPFFNRIFFFIEALVCLAKVPTSFPDVA